jgi:N-acetylglucosamine-6-phosphate deacetylase
MMKLLITGPKVYTATAILTNAAVSVHDGLISAIGANKNDFSAAQTVEFPETYHLIPGFIDLHTHGAAGHDVMDATPAALTGICQALAQEGTTSFLATTMTAEISQIENALHAVQEYMQTAGASNGAAILGVHLEGPFLAPGKKGAQSGDHIIHADIALFKKWEIISGNMIKIVTLAPEQPAALDLIKYLRQQKIISALGHTNATYAEARAGIAAGSSYATHLFNAMTGIHHRDPGAVTAALLADSVTAELIVDGFHLHPAIVELAVKVKGHDKIVLVTDAMRAKCMPDGCYQLGGQEVQVKKGCAQLADGTLAGSVLKIPSAIQNILKFTGCSLHDAVKMATENPARLLNIFQRTGSIAQQKDADLVVLNEELKVVLTVCKGKIIYSDVGIASGAE